MPQPRQLRDINLMKLLIDPRRGRILELAAERPVSVNQLAEKIGELPSRVYYHVHKLEEAGLLELVETRQHGNLIEKLYQCPEPNQAFAFDPIVFGQNLPSILQEFERILVPGLKLLEHTAKLRLERAKINPDEGRRPGDPDVSMSVSWDTMTRSQWKEKLARLTDDDAAQRNEPPSGTSANPGERSEQVELDPQKRGHSVGANETEGQYAFVVLSYRLDDAQALGLYQPDDTDEEDRSDVPAGDETAD